MTFDELKAKYGDVKLLFDYYYKYRFTFTGTAEDGVMIVLSIGGTSDDIYRFSVSRDVPCTLNSVEEPVMIDVNKKTNKIYVIEEV